MEAPAQTGVATQDWDAELYARGEGVYRRWLDPGLREAGGGQPFNGSPDGRVFALQSRHLNLDIFVVLFDSIRNRPQTREDAVLIDVSPDELRRG